MQPFVMLKHAGEGQVNAQKTDHFQHANQKFPPIRDSAHKEICRERVKRETEKGTQRFLACRLVGSCPTQKERRGENYTQQEKQSFWPLHSTWNGLATD